MLESNEFINLKPSYKLKLKYKWYKLKHNAPNKAVCVCENAEVKNSTLTLV